MKPRLVPQQISFCTRRFLLFKEKLPNTCKATVHLWSEIRLKISQFRFILYMHMYVVKHRDILIYTMITLVSKKFVALM